MKTMSMIAAGLALSLAACGGGSSSNGPDASGSSCSLVGAWNVTGSPGTTWTGNSDGSATLSLGGAGTISETWQVMNGNVGFTDTAATGAGASQKCAADVVGIYSMAFASDCKMVTFTVVDDACSQRAQIVNHLSMTRP